MKSRHTVLVVCISTLTSIVGCAADDAAPFEAVATDDGSLEPQATLTSVNADGTWTATPNVPTIVSSGNLKASAAFTGPANKTRKMGVCSLRRAQPTGKAYKICTSVADCFDAPTTLPTGGARYCALPDGETQSQCYYREGPQQGWCAGSPALGGTAVAPGTYETPVQSTSYWHVSYACFEGCTATDPAVSSAGRSLNPGGGHS